MQRTATVFIRKFLDCKVAAKGQSIDYFTVNSQQNGYGGFPRPMMHCNLHYPRLRASSCHEYTCTELDNFGSGNTRPIKHGNHRLWKLEKTQAVQSLRTSKSTGCEGLVSTQTQVIGRGRFQSANAACYMYHRYPAPDKLSTVWHCPIDFNCQIF